MTSAPARRERCPECRTEWAPRVVACPSCRRLVHADALARIAEQAASLRERADHAGELERWRRALELLPPESKQAARIADRTAELAALVAPIEPEKKAAPGGAATGKWLAGLGAFGLFAWKANVLLLFVATKGKLLLTGIASWQTVLSMAVAFGVYWVAWGWPFALGVIVSLYIHELGHIVALKRYGIPASAPMFIPGLGAFVRLHRGPDTPEQDARVGLAGPWFGLAASLAAFALYRSTDVAMLGAIARVGAWINLLNLIPIWQLDGGRGFASLTRAQRGLAAAAIAGAALLSGERSLVLLLLCAGFRALAGAAPEKGDRSGLAQYVALVAALSALSAIDVPTP